MANPSSEQDPAALAAADVEAPFRFVHSPNFPELLHTVGGTLLVTTYQAGKLVTFRARDGRLSMLLRTFDKAMGLAVQPQRIAIGTTCQVWTLCNSPEVAAKMKPAGQHDACFLPRGSHVTGNIDIHEIAWGRRSGFPAAEPRQTDGLPGEELWVVNTLFSCLCTLEPQSSFVPRWRPPFVTEIRRQDRCHLNGVAMVDGRPGFVTAFGETDSPEGWRPGKVDGGVVIDVESGETIARGLSMPHSPRVHDGRLWVLDSGRGRLSVVDRRNGKTDTVAELPGYTRGLAFAGNLAFVGLSKIREKAVFGGIPIGQPSTERKCGVAVVDTHRGEIVALLDFQQSVEELFDVQLLLGTRFPAVVGFQKETIQRACVIGRERPIRSGPADDAVALLDEGRLPDAREPLDEAFAANPNDVTPLRSTACEPHEIDTATSGSACIPDEIPSQQPMAGDGDAASNEPQGTDDRGRQAEVCNGLGLSYNRQQQYSAALTSLQQAIQLKPDYAQAHNNLGNALLGLGRPEDAVVAYRNATRADPHYAKAWSNLGHVLQQLKQFDPSEKACRRAVEIDPGYAIGHNNLGNAQRALEKLDAALASYTRAVEIQPGYARARCNLASVLRSRERLDEAETQLREALRCEPDLVDARSGLAHTLLAAKRWDESEEVFRAILRDSPNLADARCGLGNVELARDRLEEALVQFEAARDTDPDSAMAWNDSGLALQGLARFAEAISNYERALQLAPDNEVAHRNLAYALLQQGDFQRAWPHFEWRWKDKSPSDPPLDSPNWDGSPLDGRTLVVFSEQGLGDTIQFLRFAPLLSGREGSDETARSGGVVLACQPALVPLARTCPGIDQVLPKDGPVPVADVHAPLMSLPALLGTTLDTIPADVPYLFAREDRKRHWQAELDEIDGFKVGISWQGNPDYKADRQRSVPLAHFAPLAEVEGVTLISLQKGFGSEQLAAIDFPVIDLGSRLDEETGAFEDTAAVVTRLDLVVSSDTVTVHLAGALGVPVWVALSHVPDWRFLLERDDSPWYPTMRLFRQSRRGDWTELFQRIAAVLEERGGGMG